MPYSHASIPTQHTPIVQAMNMKSALLKSCDSLSIVRRLKIDDSNSNGYGLAPYDSKTCCA